ncbi:hypothetical protein FB451DRAFT_1177222 [Mycena latifolia]|nr:hypothetical protein FB451DRAFT_1177222 [Mycena latifolia]
MYLHAMDSQRREACADKGARPARKACPPVLASRPFFRGTGRDAGGWADAAHSEPNGEGAGPRSTGAEAQLAKRWHAEMAVLCRQKTLAELNGACEPYAPPRCLALRSRAITVLSREHGDLADEVEVYRCILYQLQSRRTEGRDGHAASAEGLMEGSGSAEGQGKRSEGKSKAERTGRDEASAQMRDPRYTGARTARGCTPTGMRNSYHFSNVAARFVRPEKTCRRTTPVRERSHSARQERTRTAERRCIFFCSRKVNPGRTMSDKGPRAGIEEQQREQLARCRREPEGLRNDTEDHGSGGCSQCANIQRWDALGQRGHPEAARRTFWGGQEWAETYGLKIGWCMWNRPIN